MTESKPPFKRPDTLAPSNLAYRGANRRAAESGPGRILNRYQPGLPGVACGIAAIAMAAMTFGLLVVVPATIGSGIEATRIAQASPVLATAPAEVVTATAAQAAAEVQSTIGCDRASRSRVSETRCPKGSGQPAKSDSRGVGCLDVS
ncbi:MAG TPA: hypothetical protein VH704_02040 [Casimicrobiaceae bacterium]|nr:hypothetical protein [Casimicrobiaceae bacterium]